MELFLITEALSPSKAKSGMETEKKKKPRPIDTRGRETILVIDDEPSILNIAGRILRRFGYHILLATNGEEAIELVQNYKDSIDLILLDYSMPGLTSDEACCRLIQLRPEMKVIISSGYSMDESVQELLDAGAHGFLQKPYTINSLTVRVREVLDA